MLIKKVFLFSLGILLFTISYAANYAVQVPITNLYKDASETSPIISQAIYGADIKIIQRKSGWVFVKTDDNYQGWVKNSDIAQNDYDKNATTATVKNLFVNVYKIPDTITYPPITNLPFGAKINITKREDERWLQMRLLNGEVGYIQQGDINLNSKLMSMQEMLATSTRFVGLPYLWAGTSTYGFDCSGFVQFLYRQVGIILPRDGIDQANWPRFKEATRDHLHPGDVLYFGWNNVISHAAIYLGNNKMVNSTAFQNPTVQVSDFSHPHWQELFIAARRLDPEWDNRPDFQASIEPIPQDLQEKMRQYTWHSGCPVPIEDLVLLRLSYWGYDYQVHQGVLIINKKLANEVRDIFNELYDNRFLIEKMQPIENYSGDDQRSMRDNNTSAFNCRPMTDYPNQYSAHSYGSAIDINPLINPYTNGKKIEPKEGEPYLKRDAFYKGKINSRNIAYKIFAEHGWVWGGDWPGALKDYQHFEKSFK